MSAPVTPPTDKQAAKREEILNVAWEIFAKEGFGRTSMDQIHACVGGSKRTLYKHFSNKEKLFEAMIERISGRVIKALKPRSASESLEATLFRMGVDYLTVLLSEDGLALYRAMTSEAQHFPELSRDFFENGPEAATKSLAQFLSLQQSKGSLPDIDLETAAELFLGAVRGNLHLSAVLAGRSHSPEIIHNKVSDAVRAFLKD